MDQLKGYLTSTHTNKAASVRYVLHRDVSEDKWNVFKKIGVYEDFIKSFTELQDAQDFCDINNGVEAAKK
jgi:hypothetical protein